MPVLCGYVLARRRLLHDAALEDLSKLLINFLLPCFLFTGVVAGIATLDWKNGLILLLASPLYTFGGLALGWALARMMRIESNQRRAVTACIGFANAGYIPIGIVPALVAATDLFGETEAAKTRGLIYVAMFLFLWTPLMWSLGVNMFRAKADGERKWWQAISPPFVAVLIGVAIGSSPLQNLLVGINAPLGWLQEGLYMLGTTATPLVMLVLGGTLAEIHWNGHVRINAIASVVIARSIVMPLVVFGLIVLAVKQFGKPDDPLMLFILLLQGTMPPATNLAVIARRYDSHPQLVSAILLVSYLAALISIPLWLALFVRWLSAP